MNSLLWAHDWPLAGLSENQRAYLRAREKEIWMWAGAIEEIFWMIDLPKELECLG